jgi:SPP1 gp7 family putative phage head morphogenesis protein
MSADDFILDASTRHQIYVQRFAGGQVKEMLGYLRDLVFQIEIKLAQAETLSQAQKLTVNLREVREILEEGLQAASGNLLANVEDLAEYEGEFAVKTLNAAATVDATLPESPVLRAIVSQSPMNLLGNTDIPQSLTARQAVETYSRKKSTELLRVIQNGYINGDPVGDISQAVRSVVKRQTRQADALVRTITNHISAEARSVTHRENSDVLIGEEYVATLDDRTTIGCAALDGKVFGFNEPPQVPRHWNCRSVRVAKLNPKYAQPGETGVRSSQFGPVSAKATYSSWFKKQPKSFQEKVLGKERAQLYRNGGLNIEKFTDDLGVTYSLDELKRLEPEAFEIAGIG